MQYKYRCTLNGCIHVHIRAFYSKHGNKFNTFHLRNLRPILTIKWPDLVKNTDVDSRAGLQSPITLIQQRKLRWRCHVHRIEYGRILTPTESWLKARECGDVHAMRYATIRGQAAENS